jgi:hypothetical protein
MKTIKVILIGMLCFNNGLHAQHYSSGKCYEKHSVYVSGIINRFLPVTFCQYNTDLIGGEIKYKFSSPAGIGYTCSSYFAANETGNTDMGFNAALYVGQRNAGVELGGGYGFNPIIGGHIDIPATIHLWFFTLGYRCSLFRTHTNKESKIEDVAFNNFIQGELPVSHQILVGIRLNSW